MIDCKDNPIMADSRDDIAGLEPVCAAVAMPGGVEGAGDGQCNELSAADMCDEETLASAGSASATEICSHPCALEMIDCIDSPVLANSRDAVELMRDTCTGPAAGCVPIIFDMGTFFGEACCSGAGQACADGPPAVCTTGCAAIFLPFMEQCGAVMRDPDTGIAPEMASAMASFRGVCARSHPAKGGGGH